MGLPSWVRVNRRRIFPQNAGRALYELVAMLDRGQRIDGLTIASACLFGLIRRYVAAPRNPAPHRNLYPAADHP